MSTSHVQTIREDKIESDYHPLPHEFSCPDTMVLPLVIPAKLDRAKFDPSETIATTFLDARGRMRSQLMRVVGFDFRDLMDSQTESYTKTKVSSSSSSSGSIGSSGGSLIYNKAIDIIQTAYLATDAVLQLVTAMEHLDEKCKQKFRPIDGEEEMMMMGVGDHKKETGLGFAPEIAKLIEEYRKTNFNTGKSPSSLIWCCAYTPPGIETSYWSVEAALCQYNLLVICFQMAFIQLHTHRSVKFNIGNISNVPFSQPTRASAASTPNPDDPEALYEFYVKSKKRKEELETQRTQKPRINKPEKQKDVVLEVETDDGWIGSAARAARCHCKAILEQWDTRHYDELALLGIVPDNSVFRQLDEILVLLEYDFWIFHSRLPLFRDVPGTYESVRHHCLIPRDLDPSEVKGSKTGNRLPNSELPRRSLAELANNEIEVKYIEGTLAIVVLARTKAMQVYNSTFFDTVRNFNGLAPNESVNWFSDSLNLRNPIFLQLSKYLIQAPMIYEFLTHILKFNILARGDPETHWANLFFPHAGCMKLRQNPCFNLMIYSVDTEHYKREIITLLNDRNKAERSITRSGAPGGKGNNNNNEWGSAPSAFTIDQDRKRVKVAIPSEALDCDLLFTSWNLRFFGQFPHSILRSIIHTMAEIREYFVKNSEIILNMADRSNPHNFTLLASTNITPACIARIRRFEGVVQPYQPLGESTRFANNVTLEIKKILEDRWKKQRKYRIKMERQEEEERRRNATGRDETDNAESKPG